VSNSSGALVAQRFPSSHSTESPRFNLIHSWLLLRDPTSFLVGSNNERSGTPTSPKQQHPMVLYFSVDRRTLRGSVSHPYHSQSMHPPPMQLNRRINAEASALVAIGSRDDCFEDGLGGSANCRSYAPGSAPEPFSPFEPSRTDQNIKKRCGDATRRSILSAIPGIWY